MQANRNHEQATSKAELPNTCRESSIQESAEWEDQHLSNQHLCTVGHQIPHGAISWTKEKIEATDINTEK